MRRRLANRSIRSKRTAMTGIAAHTAHIAVVEQRCLCKCLRRNTVAYNTFRACRSWNMRRGAVFYMTTVATGSDIRMIESRPGKRRCRVAGMAILARRNTRMIGRYA